MNSPEEKADSIIKGLMATGVTTAVIPAPLGIPFIAVVATGVVGIGRCYGVALNKQEAWKLIREFFKAAGITFTALQVGWTFISAIVNATGVGYPVSVALDATQATAISFAVGSAAKHYFAQQAVTSANTKKLDAVLRNELGAIMRSKITEAKRPTTVA
jgi:uncharacterized protein (DUF697 family)